MQYEEVALSIATIETKYLLNNVQTFKDRLQPSTKFMAVVKANAYSHGAVKLAGEMEKANAVDYFGVAQLIEGLELRDNGIQTPILVFNAVRDNEVEYAIQNDIAMTAFTLEHTKAIVQKAEELEKTAIVHIKIDSGMSRLGIRDFDEALGIYEALESEYVNVEGIYTHFADATKVDAENFTHEQFARFKDILDQFDAKDITFAIRHSCNTAGTINFPEYHLDMVRVGIGIHGFNPSQDKEAIQLTPTQTVQTTITYIKDFPAGESVGYDRNFFSEKPMKIATIAIGYADGVAKSLSNKGFFTHNGTRLPILGEVCMDQLMIDITELPDLKIGDQVFYFGREEDGNINMAEVAQHATASKYDLLCRMGTRVRRVYP